MIYDIYISFVCLAFQISKSDVFLSTFRQFATRLLSYLKFCHARLCEPDKPKLLEEFIDY